MKRRTLGVGALTLLATARRVRAQQSRGLIPAPQGAGWLRFPRDFGSHPETAIEWWYVTGSLAPAAGSAARWGFQVTFFRVRVPSTQAMVSRLAARQLILAHTAVTDLQAGRLLHDQRLGRSAQDPESGETVGADTNDTRVRLRDWHLTRSANGYRTQIRAVDFALELNLAPTQPVLLQGDGGWSRKGPLEQNASRYYSWPHLEVTGRLGLGSDAHTVYGKAWLDHEWSNAMLPADAVGWDWTGMHLAGGGALTAFRLRRGDGSPLWAGGSWRADAASPAEVFAAHEVVWTPGRLWKSPQTGATYPVQWSLQLHHPKLPPELRRLRLQALLDAQELDSRRSTGAVYWEGLSALRAESGTGIGLGYLEMTGYHQRLRLG